MNDSSLSSPLTQPSPLPTPHVLPPESARDFLANGLLCLRANTSVTLDSAFLPCDAYERAMKLFQQAIEKLDQERA